MSDLIGLRTGFVVGGIATRVMGVVFFFIPTAVHIEDGRPPAEAHPSVESQQQEAASAVTA